MQPIQRLPLLVKWTKRCSSCNHTLVKPEVKRPDPSRERDRERDRQMYKIKLVASLYVPQVELGNRRRMRTLDTGGSAISKRASIAPLSEDASALDVPENRRYGSLLPSESGKEHRRQSLLPLLRGNEKAEKLDAPLLAGSYVSVPSPTALLQVDLTFCHPVRIPDSPNQPSRRRHRGSPRAPASTGPACSRDNPSRPRLQGRALYGGVGARGRGRRSVRRDGWRSSRQRGQHRQPARIGTVAIKSGRQARPAGGSGAERECHESSSVGQRR